MTSPDLASIEKAIDQIFQIAERFGLDPFPIYFEIVPPSIMYEFGAYGLPGRFSHWTHGRAYQQTKTLYDYGLSKIYELVINTDPCYAFLMEGNSMTQNKLVIAHVIGHSDFFKHNAYFRRTNRKMLDSVSLNAERIRHYEFQHGRLEVEQFLDAVLSIQEHVDPQPEMREKARALAEQERREPHRPSLPTPYDDLLDLDRRIETPPEPAVPPRRFPEEPDKDLLQFIAEHAPDLADWQRDIIQIVRSEMLYFVPQMQTKIMNEGWAAYWHVRIMRELDLSDAEYLEFSHLHANVLAPSRHSLNPYLVGMRIFEDIERRWDNPTEEERRELGRTPGQGRAKIFEVREMENDVSFIRNYLTPAVIDDLDLYIYKLEGDEWKIVEKDGQKIRDMIVAGMTNFGFPYIVVEDGDYRRNRELYLKHLYEDQEIDIDYAEKTLRYVYQLWRRPVHLETVLNGKGVVLTFDGEKNTKRVL
ncbi:MAG TPA: SpoVR family protein [Chloroflexota bacterium]|jgi:stage V sporulation protein R|nr:SpoVR family protein [Chloroflexota bacterium]